MRWGGRGELHAGGMWVMKEGGGEAGNLISPDRLPGLGILPMHEFYALDFLFLIIPFF